MALTLDEAIDQVGSAPALDPLDTAVDAAAAQTEQKQRLRASVVGALKQNPDEYAQAKQLSSSTGVPAEVAARNLPAVKERAQLSEFDAYLDKSPKLAKSLSDPQFARVAHDDTPNLARLEATLELFGPGFRATQSPEPSFTNYFKGLWSSFTGGAEQAKIGLQMQSADLLGNDSIEDQVYRADLQRKFEISRGETQALQPRFESATAQGVYSGFASTLRTAPGIGLSIATRNPAPALAAAGVQTEAEAYGKYRTRGATGGEAALGAVGEGSVEVLTELLPMGFIVDRFGKTGAREFLGGLLARELPTEQVATLAQDAIDTAIANPNKTWGQYIAERPEAAYQTALATLVQSGVTGGASFGAEKLADRAQAAQAATNDAEALAQMFALAEASKVRERDPASFQQFIDAAARGGAIENLHLDAQTLQQSGVDLGAFAAASPTAAAQLPEALATGGDIVVPIGEYMANIVGTPIDAALIPHLRTSEDALSMDEAQKFFQGQAEEFKAAADKVLTERAEDDAFTKSVQAVEAKLLGDLQTAKRFTPDVNKAYATIMRDFYVATSVRLGITPEDMLAKYPVQIKAEGAAGEQTVEQSVEWVANPNHVLGPEDDQLFPIENVYVPVEAHNPVFGETVDEYANADELPSLLGKTTGHSDIERDSTFTGRWRKLTTEPANPSIPAVLIDDGVHRATAAVKRGLTEVRVSPQADTFNRLEGGTPVANAKVDSSLEQGANDGTRTDRPGLQAEQNAPRSVGGASRVDWAAKTRVRRKDGRPVLVYRGTAVDRALSAGDFAGSALGHATGHPSSGLGVWFTADNEDAARYGELVEPFHLDIRNPKIYKEDIPAFDSVEEAAALAADLRAQGFDGIALDYRSLGGPLQFVAFEPTQAIYPTKPKALDIGQFFQGERTPQTETPEFKRWFGDSKVVDASGKPLVVYHGTKAKFDTFKNMGGTVSTLFGSEKVKRSGFFFSANEDTAKSFDTRNSANVMPVYLTIRNPADFTKFDVDKRLVEEKGFNAKWLGGTASWELFDGTDGEELVQALQELGYDGAYIDEPAVEGEREAGHTWIAFSPAQIKSATGNDGSFDADDPSIVSQQARGALTFGRDITKSPSVISLFNTADLSTLLHEMGHFQLEVLAHIAQQPEAPPEIVADVDAALKWFGIGGVANEPAIPTGKVRVYHSGSKGDGQGPRWVSTDRAYAANYRSDLPLFYTDLDETDPRVNNPDYPNEQGIKQGFTFNFELTPAEAAKLSETPREAGQSPLDTWLGMSLEERRPHHEKFARGFEAYLFEGKAPNAELRGLFQRFRAWLVQVYKSVKALNVDLSDEIRGVFDRLVATEESIKAAEATAEMGPMFEGDTEAQAEAKDATESAIEELQKRSLRDMKWLRGARSKALKEMQDDAKTKREGVKAEITAEVRQIPVYSVQQFLRRGILPEGDKVVGAKLDLDALKAMYGEGPAAPWRYLPTGKTGLAGNEGLPPDTVAEMFGFTSGDHLVRELLAAEPEADLIDALTDRRMLERYGDITSPDALATAAEEAIHNEARARFVATELKALTKAAGPARAIAKAARAYAEEMIARRKVRDIKPNEHAVAEARAAKASQDALAKGDTIAAANAKRSQLVQNLSVRISYEALAEVDRALKYLRKFEKEGAREKLDIEYLEQIDQLLERFDLRRGVTNKQVAKRKSLLEWVEAQREAGFEPAIPPELLSEALRTPYKEMPLEALRGLVDTVKQIEHLGRLKHKLLTAKDEREFNDIRDHIAQSIEAHAKKVRDLRTRNTAGAMLAAAGNGFLAVHRKMASVAREMDGFEDGGPMWNYFIQSMNVAGDNETTRRAAATKKLFALVQPLLKDGKPMGGKGVYFPSLKSSFNREERIAIALNLGNAGNAQRLLDGEGWAMEKLQPLLDSLTPAEADFVQGVWDFFEGYRPDIAAKERRIYGMEPDWVEPVPVVLAGKQLRGGYYPIKYDSQRSGRVEQHADAEAARASMRGAYTTATTRRSFTKERAEAVKGRPLLYSFAGLYQGTNEVIHDLSWHEWLIDVNRLLRSLDGPIRSHYGPETVRIFKKAIEDIASGDVPAANVAERGLNHIRAGATIAGLGWNLTTSLLQPLGLTQSMVRIGPKWVAKGMGSWIKAPLAAVEEIYTRSKMMRLRGQTMQREINEIQNQVRGEKLGPVKASFFLLIQKMQLVADIPTWLGQFEKSVAAGETEERAAALADQAVVDSQGGGQIKDLAEIQRGHPALKLFTNFYSFFNVAYNLGVEKTKQKGRNPKQYPGLVLDYLLLYSVPAALATLLKYALFGGDDDDLGKKLVADQISYMLGLMVGAREVTSAVQAATGVEQFQSSYGGPAGLRLFQEIDKLGDQIKQGDADMAMFKTANNIGGIIFHYPSGQINRSVEGAVALIDGDTKNPAALMVGPPR